jgi:UDP:flavonoid glycosyltransferase YjiC (YdhE family)
MVPLARSFASRGHVVGVLTSASAANLVEPEGFDLLAVGPTFEEMIAETRREIGQDAGNGVSLQMEAYLFAGARVDLAADDALAAAEEWKPDLIVHENADYVGPLIATALQVPLVVFAFSTRRPDESSAALDEVVASRFTDRGLDRAPALRYLDTCPPSLNYPGWEPPVERSYIRPEAHRQPGADPLTPSSAKGDRPKVLVSFGTLSGFFTQPAELSALIRALGDVDVVVTLGLSGRESDYDVDPERVRFTSFVPLDQLLAGIDVMVTHGGAGTTLATLAHGVPLVVVPKGADQPRQAERVSAVGAGISLTGDAATPEAVAAAVTRCLTESSFRANAIRISQEIAAMPSPDQVVDSLEALARPRQ